MNHRSVHPVRYVITVMLSLEFCRTTLEFLDVLKRILYGLMRFNFLPAERVLFDIVKGTS